MHQDPTATFFKTVCKRNIRHYDSGLLKNFYGKIRYQSPKETFYFFLLLLQTTLVVRTGLVVVPRTSLTLFEHKFYAQMHSASTDGNTSFPPSNNFPLTAILMQVR